MNIDWFTFAAQIVNFLVLVALLRWLLYDRIVRAMNQREQRIADRLRQADQERSDAEQKAGEYERKMRQIEEQRERLLDEARQDAREEHRRLMAEVKEEVEQQRRQWQDAYRRERDDVLSDLRRQAGRSGVDAARHALAQLADAELEERVCRVFDARLRELGESQREEIAKHLGNGDVKVVIRSAFDLTPDRRERLRGTVREIFQYEQTIDFETATDLICGLELHLGGYSLGWNVENILHELEFQFDERLKSV